MYYRAAVVVLLHRNGADGIGPTGISSSSAQSPIHRRKSDLKFKNQSSSNLQENRQGER